MYEGPTDPAFLRSRIQSNQQQLTKVRQELARFQDDSVAIHPQYLTAFPSKSSAEVRQMMVAARTRDVETFEHILGEYQKQLDAVS